MWFAVPADVCKSRDKAKSAGRLFDKKRWADVLHEYSDILWVLKDLTLLELIKLLLWLDELVAGILGDPTLALRWLYRCHVDHSFDGAGSDIYPITVV